MVSGRDTTRSTAEPETKPATAATRQAILSESVETEDVQQDPTGEVRKASKVRAEEEDGTSTEPRTSATLRATGGGKTTKSKSTKVRRRPFQMLSR